LFFQTSKYLCFSHNRTFSHISGSLSSSTFFSYQNEQHSFVLGNPDSRRRLRHLWRWNYVGELQQFHSVFSHAFRIHFFGKWLLWGHSGGLASHHEGGFFCEFRIENIIGDLLFRGCIDRPRHNCLLCLDCQICPGIESAIESIVNQR
jgi:hypothetical protein